MTPITKKVWIPLGLMAALGAGGYGYWHFKNKTAAPEYQSALVERGSIEILIQSTGSVKPQTRVDIKPTIAGRAETILVREGDLVKMGQTLALTSSTERAALLDVARSQGPEVAKQWEQLYKPVPILAPISGTIILRSIEPGQTFSTSDAILAMSDRLTVEAQVDETDIAQIRLDQPVVVVLDAYPNERIPGKVVKIAYEARTINNVTTYNVMVVPDHTPEFMRSGMTANVTFEVSKKEDILLIPTSSLKTRDKKTYALTPADDPDRDKSPKEVEVETGLSDGRKIEVISGLSEGATVLSPVALSSAGKSAGKNPFMPSGPQRPRRR